jgi:hypothetical protein
MPRIESTPLSVAAPAAPQKRLFSRPWTFKPRDSSFVVFDANGIEMLCVAFTASEMRQHYPEGKTYEEALGVVQWLVRKVNEPEVEKPRPTALRGSAPPRRRIGG